MIELIYATTNQAKFKMMQTMLQDLPILLIQLPDGLPTASELGDTALENAVIKAKFYYNMLQKPCFSCDTALEIESIPKFDNPKTKIRRQSGKAMTDEETIDYYIALAKKYGKLKAKYQNAVCVALSKDQIYSSDEESLSKPYFYLVDHRVADYQKGFPLDAISVKADANYDNAILGKGFCRFFQEVLNINKCL